MRKYLKLALPALAMMFVLGTVTQSNAQGGELGKILRRMDAHNKGLTTLRADVTMGKQNAQLGDDPVISVGTALYAKRAGKDALVRIDWRKPQESLAVIDGKYYMYRPGLKMAYTGSVQSASKDTKGTSALAFMNMSKEQLSANYTAEYLGDATLSDGTMTVQLRLTPKAKTSYKTADLWIDVDGMPRQSKIVENNGDSTTVLLSNLKKNPSLKTSEFQIKWPNGTQVQKS
jgi:outer membrane lipoprotein-sorting protein